MALESYKKWTIIAVIIIVAGFVILSMTRPSYKSKESPPDTVLKQPASPGPLISLETEKTRVAAQIKEFSDNPQKLARIGDQYFERNRYVLAIEIYEKVLELNPEDVDTYNDMGLALHSIGKSDEAIEKLKKGTEVDPSFQRIWLSLGYVLVTSGRDEEAKGFFEKTIEMDPDTVMGQEAKKFLGVMK